MVERERKRNINVKRKGMPALAENGNVILITSNSKLLLSFRGMEPWEDEK